MCTNGLFPHSQVSRKQLGESLMDENIGDIEVYHKIYTDSPLTNDRPPAYLVPFLRIVYKINSTLQHHNPQNYTITSIAHSLRSSSRTRKIFFTFMPRLYC